MLAHMAQNNKESLMVFFVECVWLLTRLLRSLEIKQENALRFLEASQWQLPDLVDAAK